MDLKEEIKKLWLELETLNNEMLKQFKKNDDLIITLKDFMGSMEKSKKAFFEKPAPADLLLLKITIEFTRGVLEKAKNGYFKWDKKQLKN